MSNPANRHYYWINTNVREWTFHDNRVGEAEWFLSGDMVKHVKQTCYMEACEGDLFLGFQSTPTKKIVALGKISENEYYEEYDEDEWGICVEKYIDLEHPVSIAELKEAGLGDIPTVKKHQGTIFDLKEDEFRQILDVIERKNQGLLELMSDRQHHTLFDILEDLSVTQAIDFAKKRGANHLGWCIPLSKSYSINQIKEQFELHSIGGAQRSKRDLSVFLFDDETTDLKWVSPHTFRFQWPIHEDEDLLDILEDVDYPIEGDFARSILKDFKLDRRLHLLSAQNQSSYIYMGVAELSIISSDLEKKTILLRGKLCDTIPTSSANEESLASDDISRIEEGFESIKGGEEKEALVKQRLHHIAYRKNLISKYGDCCLCHIKDEHLLTASHIKPWTGCDSGEEKTDPNNGLLLCPNHDRLFDRGYISFDENGRIMISDALNKDDQIKMNVRPNMTIVMTPEINNYMAYHRENKYKDA